MTKIDTKVIESLPDLLEGQAYLVESADRITTERQGYDAIRLVTIDDKGKKHATMLWVRDELGETTKLGSFIAKLGNDPEKWLKRHINVISWKHGDREIEEEKK